MASDAPPQPSGPTDPGGACSGLAAPAEAWVLPKQNVPDISHAPRADILFATRGGADSAGSEAWAPGPTRETAIRVDRTELTPEARLPPFAYSGFALGPEAWPPGPWTRPGVRAGCAGPIPGSFWLPSFAHTGELAPRAPTSQPPGAARNQTEPEPAPPSFDLPAFARFDLPAAARLTPRAVRAAAWVRSGLAATGRSFSDTEPVCRRCVDAVARFPGVTGCPDHHARHTGP